MNTFDFITQLRPMVRDGLLLSRHSSRHLSNAPNSSTFGTGDLATRLMMLNAVAAGNGNWLRVRTPEYRDYIPALNLGIVGGGEALIHGAMMSLLAPVMQLVSSAMEFRQVRGLDLTQANLESLIADRHHAEREIQRDKAELQKLGPADVATPEGQAAVVDEIMGHASGKPAGPITRREELEVSIHHARLTLESIKRSIARLRLENGIHILLKDLRLREFPQKCAQSFDGNCGLLVFAPEILGELCTLPRRDLFALAAALQRTLTGSPAPGNGSADLVPGAWATLCGETDLWSEIFLRQAIADSGLLHDFVFVEAGNGPQQCDPAAMVELGRTDVWREFLDHLFLNRQCNSHLSCRFSTLLEPGISSSSAGGAGNSRAACPRSCARISPIGRAWPRGSPWVLAL